MIKKRIEVLTEVLENQLAKVGEMEKDGTKSDAFIVGYLQGTIKAVIDELKVIQEIHE
jgi:hypothetical protein